MSPPYANLPLEVRIDPTFEGVPQALWQLVHLPLRQRVAISSYLAAFQRALSDRDLIHLDATYRGLVRKGVSVEFLPPAESEGERHD